MYCSAFEQVVLPGIRRLINASIIIIIINLEKDEFKPTFLPKALEILASATPEMNYGELEANLLQLAKEELGETSGGGQLIEKET